MQKEFVSYEIALALKELGFNEPCLAYYNDEKKLIIASDPNFKSSFVFDNSNPILAPLYQQSFRFFREKYNLISYIHPLALLQDIKKWCYEITNFESSWDEDSDLHTLEEAEQACLLELINICKKK